MLNNIRLAVIGAGMMGGALARGFVQAEALASHQIVIYDPVATAAAELVAAVGTGASAVQSAAEASTGADVILLAVKPYVLLPLLSSLDVQPDQLVLSIAAGVTLEKMTDAVSNDCAIIRIMPNTPALIGRGASALSCGPHVRDEQMAMAQTLFGAVGATVVVEERLMDAVTGLSGSGPAYIYLVIEAMIDGGVKMGLPRETARLLAAQTVLGAAQMVLTTGEHPARLKDNVTTPGGTTITGLDVLEHAGVRAAISDAVEAAALRSQRLSGN